MIPVRGFEGARVAVLGLGRSGRATASALVAGGAEPLCWDDAPEARGRAENDALPLVDLTRDNAFEGVAALIVSPGIPHLYPQPSPIVERAMDSGVPIDNEIGLFFLSFATPEWDRLETTPLVIAVTGTNGKSTTAALIHHVVNAAGRPTGLAGNIGRPALDLEPARDGEVAVLELSSYQTELARALTPDIAVFTNLEPDHLDRHGGIGGYFAAKRRLFAEGAPDRAVIGIDEPEGRFLADQMAVCAADDRVIRVSSNRELAAAGWSVAACGGILSETRKGREVASIDLRPFRGLPGAHNHQNACAAYAATRPLGLSPKLIETAFRNFEGLPHRGQIVAEACGVVWVNDSKATNTASAARALQAFDRIRWIAGGLGKDGGIAALAPHLGRVAKAYLIGRSAQEFARQLGETPHEVCGSMAAAVRRAAEEAEPGDTVLLAPAAASFDQYPDFEKRGEEFTALARETAGG